MKPLQRHNRSQNNWYGWAADSSRTNRKLFNTLRAVSEKSQWTSSRSKSRYTDLEVFWRLRESENSGNNKPVNSVTGGQGRMMTSLFFVTGQKSDSCVSDQLKKPQSSVYGVEVTALINSRGNENVNHILQIIKWKDVFGYIFWSLDDWI